MGSFLILSRNCWKALADDSNADTGIVWWTLHLFFLPSGVVIVTLLLLTIADTMVKSISGIESTLKMIFYKYKRISFRSEALVTFLLSTGSVTLFPVSNL